MTDNLAVKLTIGEGEDKKHYALSFNPNGGVELFRFGKTKTGDVTIDDGSIGRYSFFKSYCNWETCAERLIALGVAEHPVSDNIQTLIEVIETVKTDIITTMEAYV